jgi:hypothetical protein
MYWSDLVAQTKNGIWKRQKTENSLVRRQWNPFHQIRPSMPQIWNYLLSSASTMEGRLGWIGNDLQPHGSTCSGIGYCPGSVWEPNCIVLGVDNQVQKVAPGGQICTKRVLSCSLWPWDPRNSRGATWQHNSVWSQKWVNFPAAEQSQPQATELQSMSNSLRTKQWQFLAVPIYLGCASVW